MNSSGSHTSSSVPPPPPSRWRRLLFRLLLFCLIVPPLAVALYTWAMFSFSYSRGDRVGYVQKFSDKGWICKTWEGELAMVNLPGAMPETFHFTARDDSVAKRINGSLGQRVVLHYEQHVGLPTSCFGDTSYFVTEVRPVSP